ncbi:MAG: flagellar hook-basal body complex protein [Planctomycetaceae bacterium]|nr:flagellar hook-basal body complex protein [Planctomycetales bacterium]MCB9924787.1 flagellar hook-basal body complex protein [Planctomycetaceae bacterium]
MGLASALSTALTGLTAAETQIDVVGNNLANSQTVGFKESGISFTTQFLQNLSLGSQPTATTGGTNPRQTGLGTQVAEIAPVFTQGTIQTSSSASDVALQGDGFFVVQSSTGEPLYTRSGIFKTNSQNELVTVNGNRLLGYAVDDEFQLQTTELVPIEVPVGSVRVAQATKNVYLEGVLPPTGDVATTGEVIDSVILGTASIPRPDTSGVSLNAAPAPNEGAVGITQADSGGTHVEGDTYRYRFAYVDASGAEATPSEERTVTVQGADGNPNNSITLNSLPAPPSGEYTRLNIYRTEPNGNSFYRLGQVDLTTTDSFVDSDPTGIDLAQPLEEEVLTGNYSYLITYANSNGETRPTPLTTSVNVAIGRVHLQNLPTPPTPGPGDSFAAYDTIRIYRNLATDSSSYYLVDEIDPSVTSEYTDSASDAAIQLNAKANLDGPTINPNTLLTDVLVRDELNFERLFKVGTLAFNGRKGGRALQTRDFEVTATSTVQELLDFIRDTTGIQRAAEDPGHPIPSSANNIPGDVSALAPGATITADGRLRFVSNNGVDNAVTVGLSGFLLTTPDGEVSAPNLGFSSSQKAVGQSAVADFLAYDSLGSPLNVRVTAIMESRTGTATTYRWFADSADNDPLSGVDLSVGTGLVTFDGQGNFISSTNTQVTIERRNTPAATPLDFNLDFTAISGLEGKNATLAASRQDGSSAGTLSSFSIGEDGTIRGAFSNGVSRSLGQIRLAKFSNPAGLEQRGQNMFAVGANSGLPVEGNPGENGIATLVSGAVELSNTDIGSNLIDLVLATTQYRGNTRVITAAQQLLEELLNLRR